MLATALALHAVLLYALVPRQVLVARPWHDWKTPRHLDMQWLALELAVTAASNETESAAAKTAAAANAAVATAASVAE